MKFLNKILLILIVPIGFILAAGPGNGPLYQHKDSEVQREFINVYQDIKRVLNSSGTVQCIDNPTFCVDSVTNQVLVSNGSALKPVYSFVNSTGTGAYYEPVTSSINLAVGGSTVALINSGTFSGLKATTGFRYGFAGSPNAYTNTTVNSSTVSVSPGSIKVFTIELSNGDGALCYTNFLSGTITVLGSSGNISNTTTPSAGNIGVNKSANSHTINFVTGSGASGTFGSWGVCFLGTAF